MQGITNQTKSKHTPGEWKSEIIVDEGEYWWGVSGKDKKIIALCGLLGDENEQENIANSYLLSAAPDMLRALKTINNAFWNQYKDPIKEIKAIVLSAIAKAEGGA